MKIRIAQDLAFPRVEEVCIEFEAETQFEKDWLSSFSRSSKEMRFDFHHPCGKGELNNPMIVLKLTSKKEGKE